MSKIEPVAWLIPGTITRDKLLAIANGKNAKPLIKESDHLQAIAEATAITPEKVERIRQWLDIRANEDVGIDIEELIKECMR